MDIESGDKMKFEKTAVTLFLSVLASLNCFSDKVEVHLQPTRVGELTFPATNLWTVLKCPPPEYEIFFPLGMPFSQSIFTNEVMLSDVISIIAISKVALVSVTDINQEDCGPIFYYKIEGSVIKIIKGTFSHNKIEFMCQYGANRGRETWPYVKGFYYYFGLNHHATDSWQITGQIRVCPLSPYREDGLVSFWDWQKNNDPQKSSKIYKIWSKAFSSDKRLLDSSVINNDFLILTFSGESYYGQLDDCTNYNDVSIKVYSLKTARSLAEDDPVYLHLLDNLSCRWETGVSK